MTPLVRRFIQLFLPMAGLILIGNHFFSGSRESIEYGRIKTTEELSVTLAGGVLDRRLQVVISDLLAIAGSSTLRELADAATPATRRRAADDFMAFSQAKPAYDQIRWIGRDGQEIVRVDHKDGIPTEIAPEQLQNKGDRYYFSATMGLMPRAVYVSELDLNIEHGEIEKPYKPMLRVATPISDNNGEKLGILILNYRADQTLDLVRQLGASYSDRLAVVNQDGYFLLAPDKADEWGFMFDRRDLSLASRHPSRWARINTLGRGQFKDEAGLWTFDTVSPLENADDGRRFTPGTGSGPRRDSGETDASIGNKPGDDYRWIAVTHLPPAQLKALLHSRHPLQWGIVLALLAVSAAACAALARTQVRESEIETRFRIYFERGMVGMAVVDCDRCWRVVNPALCSIMGYSEAEMLSRHVYDMSHPDDVAVSEQYYQRVMSGEIEGFELKKRYIRGDGKTIDAFIAVQAVRTGDGAVDYFLAMFEDITAQIAAEQALRASEERLRLLGDNLPDSYIYQTTVAPDGKTCFTYVSSGITRIQGLAPEDVIANPDLLEQNTDPAQLPELQACQLESLRTLSDFSMELRVRMAGGEWGWLLVRSRPRQLADGSIVWDGVATNITARRRAQALLDLQKRRAEALLALPHHSRKLSERDFMQYALDLIERMTDSHIAFMHFVDDDEEMIELVAWSTGTLAHYCTATFDKHYPLSKAGLWADAARTRESVVINDYASACGKKGLPDGHSNLQRIVSVPVVEEGQVRLMTGVGNKADPYDETDVETIQLIANETWRIVRQQRSDDALQIARQVVNASLVVCFRWRAVAGWPVVYVSENVERWGYRVEDLLHGQPQFSAMVHPDDLPRVAEEVSRYTAEGRNAYDQEYRLLTADGNDFWILDRTTVLRDASGKAEFYDGVITDISERRLQEQELAANLEAQRALNKRLEEAHNQLLQSEKMASIGQLAAGVAHELNNPIAFVHSNLGTLDNYLIDLMNIIDAYDRAAADPADADAALRAVALLKQDCDFDYIRNDIKPLVAESRDGLARVRKIVQDLKSFSHVSEQEWGWADLHTGLESTLNILRNELKYKCEVVKDFGEIPEVWCIVSQLNQVFMNLLVNAGHAIETSGAISIRTRAGSNGEVWIEIEDTGKGIPPENMSRIFDPFFTTKPVGSGTGLGLSLSYGIVQRHNGRIEVESEVGKGSLFRVCLPVRPAQAAASEN